MAAARPAVLRTLLAMLLAVALVGAPAAADPKPTIKELKKDLTQLQKQSDKTIADYYEARHNLQLAEKADKSVREKLAVAQEVFDHESTQLRAMAVAHYIGEEHSAIATMTGEGDPKATLTRLALTEHLVDEQNASLRGFAQVRDDLKTAKDEAQARERDLRELVKDLEGRKKKAERLIAQIRDKIDLAHKAPGFRRSDGTWVPELPGGSDNITPRMRLVKTLIAERFGDGPGIGCYRSIRDGGEHPLGRACDFMLSRGGAMPSALEVARGHQIAAWAIKNAKRLGIMYVIYRQRIWHVRNGAWRVMSDRGGTTANHYDHPHISVY